MKERFKSEGYPLVELYTERYGTPEDATEVAEEMKEYNKYGASAVFVDAGKIFLALEKDAEACEAFYDAASCIRGSYWNAYGEDGKSDLEALEYALELLGLAGELSSALPERKSWLCEWITREELSVRKEIANEKTRKYY